MKIKQQDFERRKEGYDKYDKHIEDINKPDLETSRTEAKSKLKRVFLQCGPSMKIYQETC